MKFHIGKLAIFSLTSVMTFVIASPVKAVSLVGSFNFMGTSTYLAKRPQCKDANNNVLDMVTSKADFIIKKDPIDYKESFIKFTYVDSNCPEANKRYQKYRNTGLPWMTEKIPINHVMFGENWKVTKIEFNGRSDPEYPSATMNGMIDFTGNNGVGGGTVNTLDKTNPVDVTTISKITDYEAEKAPVPEPSSILGLLALGTLGAASTLKRQLKPSKSTEKETTKIG